MTPILFRQFIIQNMKWAMNELTFTETGSHIHTGSGTYQKVITSQLNVNGDFYFIKKKYFENRSI